MIVDNEGELIWVKYTDGQAYDLVMHEFKGQQYLTYWIGDDRIRGHGQGDYYMVRLMRRFVKMASQLTRHSSTHPTSK